jgi:N6-L-threonylcarbamoyladenine synthase
MKILAFETSCDDTAVAIVENGTKVLAAVRVSQLEHNEYGGVVPEIAARLHSENWCGALEECLNFAGISIDEIDALAVTNGPGLQTSLLTGTTAASFLSLLWKKPLIPVHHIFGHISSIYLDQNSAKFSENFPVLVLTVSGGHTEFFLQKNMTEVVRLGGTLDDAAGEAFDKVAKMLGLGYPGGPIVGKFAENGDREKYKFPQPMLGKTSLDFSFSGVKSAVYREIEKEKLRLSSLPNKEKFESVDNKFNFSEKFIADICASFEQTVTEIFIKKIRRAIAEYPEVKAVHFVGGVSANKFLRENLAKFLESQGRELRVPAKFEYCTDNAAMIGSAAFWLYEKNPEIAKIQYIDADSRLKI